MKESVTCDIAMLDNLSVMKCLMTPIRFNVLLLIMDNNTISKRDLLLKCQQIGIDNDESVRLCINHLSKRQLIYTYNPKKGPDKTKYRVNKKLIKQAMNGTFHKISECLHNDTI